MSQSAALLRLLEPTVRPVAAIGKVGGVGKAGAQPPGVGEAPFEHQDFATLLASSKQELAATAEAEPAAQNVEPTPPAGPLDLLADVGRIENPGLRELLSTIASASPNTNATTNPDFNAPQ